MIVDDRENEEMSDEEKENIHVNSQDSARLLEEVKERKLRVSNKKTDETVELKTGQEAFYALLAQELLEIAQQHDRDVAEIHKMFYQVSCDREKLK